MDFCQHFALLKFKILKQFLQESNQLKSLLNIRFKNEAGGAERGSAAQAAAACIQCDTAMGGSNGGAGGGTLQLLQPPCFAGNRMIGRHSGTTRAYRARLLQPHAT